MPDTDKAAVEAAPDVEIAPAPDVAAVDIDTAAADLGGHGATAATASPESDTYLRHNCLDFAIRAKRDSDFFTPAELIASAEVFAAYIRGGAAA